MDVAREHFLSGAGFSAQHHRRIGFGNPCGQRQQVAGHRIFGDGIVALHGAHGVALDVLQQAWGSKGFMRKSQAPPRIAATALSTSP